VIYALCCVHLHSTPDVFMCSADDDDGFYYFDISSLISFIEGLRRRIQVFSFTFKLKSFALLFGKKTKFKEKKQLVQDLILPPSIYIHTCTLYTYTNTYMPRFNPSRFFGPSRCVVPTPGLTSSTPCAVCVYMCVYTHIHTHTLHPRQK